MSICKEVKLGAFPCISSARKGRGHTKDAKGARAPTTSDPGLQTAPERPSVKGPAVQQTAGLPDYLSPLRATLMPLPVFTPGEPAIRYKVAEAKVVVFRVEFILIAIFERRDLFKQRRDQFEASGKVRLHLAEPRDSTSRSAPGTSKTPCESTGPGKNKCTGS